MYHLVRIQEFPIFALIHIHFRFEIISYFFHIHIENTIYQFISPEKACIFRFIR